jgi:hypothetical protein
MLLYQKMHDTRVFGTQWWTQSVRYYVSGFTFDAVKKIKIKIYFIVFSYF